MRQTLFQQSSQPPQGQAVTGNGPIVTDMGDDDDRLDFQGGQNPHKGPPNGGPGQTTKPPRSRKHKLTLNGHWVKEKGAIAKMTLFEQTERKGDGNNECRRPRPRNNSNG